MTRNDRRTIGRRFNSPRFALASPRRVTKNAQRFVFNGYLQIADNVGNVYVWDCTEPIATRSLVWTRNGILSYYVFDGNKNVSEVIASNKDVAAHYEYVPFGAVIKSTGAEDCPDNPSTIHYSLLPIRYLNPWRFSSEFADDELGCDYYNYREYESVDYLFVSPSECKCNEVEAEQSCLMAVEKRLLNIPPKPLNSS